MKRMSEVEDIGLGGARIPVTGVAFNERGNVSTSAGVCSPASAMQRQDLWRGLVQGRAKLPLSREVGTRVDSAARENGRGNVFHKADDYLALVNLMREMRQSRMAAFLRLFWETADTWDSYLHALLAAA